MSVREVVYHAAAQVAAVERVDFSVTENANGFLVAVGDERTLVLRDAVLNNIQKYGESIAEDLVAKNLLTQ